MLREPPVTHTARCGNVSRDAWQTREWRSVFVIAVESAGADTTALELLATGNLEWEPVQAVRGIRIELLEIRHLSYLRRDSDEMASVQAENLHGLQCPDRGRKGHDLFPFFGSYLGNRIKFIASIGSDFQNISLKRFPSIGARVLNLPVQREFRPFSIPSEAVTLGIATDWIRPQHRVRYSLPLIESRLEQFHVIARGFRLTSAMITGANITCEEDPKSMNADELTRPLWIIVVKSP